MSQSAVIVEKPGGNRDHHRYVGSVRIIEGCLHLYDDRGGLIIAYGPNGWLTYKSDTDLL